MKLRRNLFIISIFTFGALTLFMSGSVIFDLFNIRASEGNYVPFIVWINFICSFMYLYAGFGFLRSIKWTLLALQIALLLLIAGLIASLFYISRGGLYEHKTVVAMIFRLVVTLLFFFFVRRGLRKADL